MRQKILLCVPIILLALLFVFGYRAIHTKENSVLRVHFLDIGQGDAIFIEDSNGNQILIDGGKDKKILSKLGEIMAFNDRTIDMVIATHPDLDHIGGLPFVLDRYDVDFLMEPDMTTGKSAERALHERAEQHRMEKVIGKRGIVVSLSDSVHLVVLSPQKGNMSKDTNDNSIVAKLMYGETSFLFTGDASLKIEKRLIKTDGAHLKSDVLKAGHHGSRTSSSKEFVALVSPRYAVISAGKDNSYGHPHKQVIEILSDSRARILRTYEKGTITFVSDGHVVTEK